MTDETDPIELDETLLRRIPNNPEFVNESLELPVIRLAYKPQRLDTDGLSVFRELFTSAQEIVDQGTNVKGYYVAALSAGRVVEIAGPVIPDPLPAGPRGHSLIPSICVATKDATSAEQLELARLASENLVFRPK